LDGAGATPQIVMPGQKREARLRVDDPGASIFFLAERMDCRVEPGNDGLQLQQRTLERPSP
jgi:hypothetical protein